MILSPLDIIRFQTCPRRWALERSWRSDRQRPKAIFDRALRGGVLALSDGMPVAKVRDEARAQFMAAAADPGMEVAEGADPYRIAGDLCAVLDTSLTAISMLTLLALRRVVPIALGDGSPHLYRPLAFSDESGCLHRWLTVDAWDDDALTAEMHSWVTAADMAVCDAPLTLHVIVIGSRRNSRQHSPWCKGALQPLIGKLRFARKDTHQRPQAIPDDWRTVWYADWADARPEEWVEALIADGIMPRLIHHPAIAEFPATVRRETLRQLSTLADDMDRTAQSLTGVPGYPAADREHATEPAMSLPMARGACDGPRVACPWRRACYRVEPGAGIEALGGYSRLASSGRDGGRRENTSAPLRTTGIAASHESAMKGDRDGIQATG